MCKRSPGRFRNVAPITFFVNLLKHYLHRADTRISYSFSDRAWPEEQVPNPNGPTPLEEIRAPQNNYIVFVAMREKRYIVHCLLRRIVSCFCVMRI